MSDQEVCETCAVRLEAFGETRGPWHVAGGTREDLRRLEDEIRRTLRRHDERLRSGPLADQVGDVDEEFSPGHPGPSTGHS